jgi:hypothetical protein
MKTYYVVLQIFIIGFGFSLAGVVVKSEKIHIDNLFSLQNEAAIKIEEKLNKQIDMSKNMIVSWQEIENE